MRAPETKSKRINPRIVFYFVFLGSTIISSIVLSIGHPLSDAVRLEKKGKYQDAIELYTKALDNPLYAIDPTIYLGRAYSFRKLEEFEPGLEDLAKAKAVRDKYWWLWGFEGFGVKSSIDFQILYERGWNRYSAGKYKEAIEIFTKALKFKKDYSAYYSRAACYEDLGEYKKAELDYDKEVETANSTKKELAYHDRAQYFMRRGEQEKALSDLNQAIASDDCAVAYSDRARIYRRSGKFEQALSDLERSLFFKRTPKTLAYRAGVLAEDGQLQAALKDVDEAISLEPDSESHKDLRKRIVTEIDAKSSKSK